MKSHKTYYYIATCIYNDAIAKCVAEYSQRDLNYIKSRIEREGLSFLTITLPEFSRDFERSLANSQIDPTFFRRFRKNRRIPAFLQGIVGLLFDKETGRLNDDLHPPFYVSTLVESVRQICLAFKKIEIPCEPKRARKAMEDYIEIENSFSEFKISDDDRKKFSYISSVLWDGLVANLCLNSALPKHGPGATAERISGNSKFVWRRWHDRLEPYFPLVETCYPISIWDNSAFPLEFESVAIVSEEDEHPARVSAVPKTLKGPRLIAIEPCCNQYVQQGLRGILYDAIQSYWLTAGHINFSDQSINQSLAISSSSDGQLATIDLSDASDRVPHDLAMEMFQSNPDVKDAIEACRSKYVQLPDGRKIGPLQKFASMGSALCFPIEAMYFYTICVMALLDGNGLPVSRRNMLSVASDLYVYGDDIICPTKHATIILEYLTKYNCKVNSNKTFITGKFRESCGVDAYNGTDITPVYIRRPQPKNELQASEILSWISTARQFYRKGLCTTSYYMFHIVEKVVGALPTTDDYSPVPGRNHQWFYSPRKRWNKNLQHFEVKCWVPEPVKVSDPLDGFAALNKCLRRLEGKTFPSFFSASKWDGSPMEFSIQDDVSHLELSALHGRVAIKRRWVPTTLVG